MRRLLCCLVFGVLMVPVLRAHHGSEFITLADYDIGHAGDGLLNFGFDVERFDGGDELSSELGMMFTPAPRIGLGVNVRFAEDGRGDWVYSSVSPRVQIQLTDPHSERRFRVGVSVGYQFAEDLSYEETTTTFEDIVIRKPEETRQVTTEVTTTETGGGDTSCNPLLDLDCIPTSSSGRVKKHSGSHTPVVTATKTSTVTSGGETEVRRESTTTTTRKGVSSHSGIHNHDTRQWFGRLIVETEIGQTKLTGNLISVVPDGDRAYWGYGIGARRPVVGDLAAGVEFIGDFEADGEHEAVASLHYRMLENATARLGVGVGLTDESPDLTVRTGIVLRF